MVSSHQLKILARFSSLPLSVALAFSIAMKPPVAQSAELTNIARQQIESYIILQEAYEPPVTGTPTNDGGSGSRT